MEKNNTTTSNLSICKKIRHALTNNLTLKNIYRMKQYNQEAKPQHIKIVNIEGGNRGGSIPIMFDYSMVHSNASKVASPNVGISEIKGKLVTKVEPEGINYPYQDIKIGKINESENYNGKPLKVGLVNLEKQGKKSLDINDAFSEYIHRTSNRIRTVSNVGKGQNNNNHVLDDDASSFSGVNNKMENHNDHFSDFIREAKKRIKTTSNVGKTSSLKKT